MAKAISKIDSSKTEQEWIDIGKQELTDEQKQVAKEILIDNFVPEIAEVIEVDPEANEVIFRDTDGNEWIMEADPEIAAMTDEEARAYTKQLMESLGVNTDNDDGRIDFGNNAVDFPSNSQENQGNESEDNQVIEDNHQQPNQTQTDENHIIYDADEGPIVIDPWAGMTPEEKAAQQEADRQATQKDIDATQGTMH